MEFSVPGFIKRYCSPNAMLTLAEYLEDYASTETKSKGYEVINLNIRELAKFQKVDDLVARIEKVKAGERDLYF